MTRYIPDLPSYTLEQLIALFYEIDSYLEHPDQNSIPYTVGQYQFVKKLIVQKGGTIPEVA
jgi:hypothetical protein|tara:strand:- start:331 stop:513 length:183 start_codon:yes stop_codon:yes gene_type:complete